MWLRATVLLEKVICLSEDQLLEVYTLTPQGKYIILKITFILYCKEIVAILKYIKKFHLLIKKVLVLISYIEININVHEY